MNSPYSASLEIVAINLATKRKCEYFIAPLDPTVKLEQCGIQILPNPAGSLDSGTRLKLQFKFELLPKETDRLKIQLSGDTLSEYDLFFSTQNHEPS